MRVSKLIARTLLLLENFTRYMLSIALRVEAVEIAKYRGNYHLNKK